MTTVITRKAPSGRYIALIFSFFFLIMSFFSNTVGGAGLAIYLLVASTVALTIFADSRNVFHISILTGHYAFWMMPLIVSSYINVYINFYAIFWSLSAVIYAIYMTDSKYSFSWKNISVAISPVLFFSIYIFSIFLLVVTSGLTFISSIGVIIVAGALCMNRGEKLTDLLIFLALISYAAIYYIEFWNGFGRLVVLGVFVIIIFMYCMRIGFHILLKPVVMFLIPFATILGSFLRFNVYTIEDALWASTKDSAIGPFMLLSKIFDSRGYPTVNDFWGWVDQIVLFFFPIIPRAIWVSKPNGFGFQYTVDNLDQYLIDAGHSVAANFLGEHVYYLGAVWGVFGMFFSINVVIFLYKALANPNFLGGYGVFVIGIWIPTYYWGGMQAFSARFMICCIPLFLLLALQRVYMWLRPRSMRSRRPPTQRRI